MPDDADGSASTNGDSPPMKDNADICPETEPGQRNRQLTSTPTQGNITTAK